MKVETYLFGTVEVNPERVINFPNGLVGLEDNKQFMLVHDESNAQVASFTLQSLDDPAIALQIVDPTAMGFHYELALSDAETALLQTPAAEEVAVMLVVYKQDEQVANIGANIRAPLLINTRAKVGLQKVIEKMCPNVTISNLSSNV